MIAELKRSEKIAGECKIDGSKSISNRLLIIRHLCNESFHIKNLSNSRDSIVLKNLLSERRTEYYAEDGGTTSRFILPVLCLLQGEQKLSASEQLSARPIKPLVDALMKLGAGIEYDGNEGELPLTVKSSSLKGGKISIRGDISSQFISSLMLVGPYLVGGLQIEIETDTVSDSYISMTRQLMHRFGVEVRREQNSILIAEGTYKPPYSEFNVEADWSSASFYIALCAASEDCNIKLIGLKQDSIQGDMRILEILNHTCISSRFSGSGLEISNINGDKLKEMEIDLRSTPDLFPPLAACFALKNTNVSFSGLSHLAYKETDRYLSLKRELAKVGCAIMKDGDNIKLQVTKDDRERDIIFDSHNDHRIAMACSLFALKYRSVRIQSAEAVKKSNPWFWDQMKAIGFDLNLLPE